MNLQDINKNITFKEESHQYFYKKKEFTSVSKLLGFYKPKFDPEGHISRACAKRDGITVEELKAQWEKKKNDAAERGQQFHSEVEHFIKNKKILKGEFKPVVEQISEIPFKGLLHSEIGLNSPKFKLAGTCDVAELMDVNVVRIWDLKLQKEFDIKSKYGTKMLYPLNHLDSCRLVHYSLQILLYGEMLLEHGFGFIPGQILYVDSKTLEMIRYDILDLKKEIKKLLEHYSKIMAW